jgi:DNA-binding transcriptional LysR family regulator
MGRFLDRYPQLHIDLDLTDRLIDLVREKFDLSVRIGRPREQSYVIRRLCPFRALVCASPGYLERHGTPQVPDDLEAHNCLGYTTPPETWNFVGGKQVRTSGNLNADNGDALRSAARQGLGIVYLPTSVIGDDIRAGRLVPLLVEDVDIETSVYAVYPESRHISPKVRALIDWLVEELGHEPDWDRKLPRRRV